MSVLAEITVPASEFVLADTLTTASGMRIEIKRVVAGSARVTPYFWATGGDFEGFEQALGSDPTIADVLTLEAQSDDERFYRVTWESSDANLVSAVSDAKATVLEAVTDDDDEWSLKVLFPDRNALSAFHEYCVTHDFSFQLERVYRAENPQEEGEYDITREQQEALEAAYEAGYFDVPRETTLTELADRLGISSNALSARLRRGHRNLLSNTLVHEK